MSKATRIRAVLHQTIAGEPPSKGAILAALRRSPLVGADLDLARSHEAGRRIDEWPDRGFFPGGSR